MRLASWNVNGIKARLPYILGWLDEVKPDVVGLQEIKSIATDFPSQAFAERGYELAVSGQKAWNGVAVASRGAVRVVGEGLAGQEELGARMLSVETLGLTFTTIYAPNGKSLEHPDFESKLGWLDALLRWLHAAESRRPHLVGGDFNVAPAPIDSWSEERMRGGLFHTADERARIDAIKAAGFVDLWRAAHPDDPGFTWWDYRQGSFHKRQGLRIDLLLATPELAARAQSICADRRWRKKQNGLISSDHIPVVVDLVAG